MWGNTRKSTAVFITLSSFFILSLVVSMPIASASLMDIIRALVTINPLEVNVVIQKAPEAGSVFKIEARLVNRGGRKISDLEARILLPQEVSLMGPQTKNAGTLPPNKNKVINWSAVSESAGNFVVSLVVSGELQGQRITAENSALIIVKERRNSHGGQDIFSELLELIQRFINRSKEK